MARSLCRSSGNYVSNCSSSLRYKKDVARFTGGLAVINRLRPIAFTGSGAECATSAWARRKWKRSNHYSSFRNDKGEIEGVKYNQLSAVFVNAFKEQQEQITQQTGAAKQQQDKLPRCEQLTPRLTRACG